MLAWQTADPSHNLAYLALRRVFLNLSRLSLLCLRRQIKIALVPPIHLGDIPNAYTMEPLLVTQRHEKVAIGVTLENIRDRRLRQMIVMIV
jgi:hypothetical protein